MPNSGNVCVLLYYLIYFITFVVIFCPHFRLFLVVLVDLLCIFVRIVVFLVIFYPNYPICHVFFYPKSLFVCHFCLNFDFSIIFIRIRKFIIDSRSNNHTQRLMTREIQFFQHFFSIYLNFRSVDQKFRFVEPPSAVYKNDFHLFPLYN